MKKLFRNIADLFKRVFTGILGTARKFVKPSVVIVQALKLIVESDVTSVAVALTKTKVDDILIQRARKVLPAILHMLQLTTECLGSGDRSNDEIIQCALEKLRLYNPEARKGFYLQIAGHLSAALSDGKFSFGEVVGLAWYIYHDEVEPLRLAA